MKKWLKEKWESFKAWAAIILMFAIFIGMIGFSCADNIGRVYFWWSH